MKEKIHNKDLKLGLVHSSILVYFKTIILRWQAFSSCKNVFVMWYSRGSRKQLYDRDSTSYRPTHILLLWNKNSILWSEWAVGRLLSKQSMNEWMALHKHPSAQYLQRSGQDEEMSKQKPKLKQNRDFILNTSSNKSRLGKNQNMLRQSCRRRVSPF